MLPYIGGIHSYSLFLVLATFTGAPVFYRGLRAAGVPTSRALALHGQFALFALLGAKAFAVAERGGLLPSVSAELFDGYRYPGAVLGLVVALALVARPAFTGISRWRLGDILAPSICFGTAVLRVGCLLNGCCAGQRCDLAWCIRFPAHSAVWDMQVVGGLIAAEAETSLAVHPLQLYFLFFAVALGVSLVWLQPREMREGQIAALYLAADGFGKFFLEFFREHPLPVVQVASLAFALIGSGLLVRSGWRPVDTRHRVAETS